MNKLTTHIYTITFVVLLCIVPMATLLNIGIPDNESFTRIENRNPSIFPVFEPGLTQIKSYFGMVDNYINDRYSFRNEMITAWSSLIFEMGSSANQNKVVIGKNGYLFLGNHFDNMINQVKGKIVFNKEEFEAWSKDFLLRQKYLEQFDIPFYMVVVPKKHSVYPEYLPDYIIPARENVFTQIRKYNDQLDIIYLIDTLKKATTNWGDLLYNKTDSHWSEIGAYVAYRELIDDLKSDFTELRPVLLEKSDFIVQPHPGGQNRHILRISQEIDDFSVRIVDSDKWKKNVIKTNFEGDTLPFHCLQYINYHEKAIVYNPESPYTMLLFEDSFSIKLSTYLNQSFGKIIYCHYSDKEALDFTSLIEKHKPDLVLYEFGEQSFARHDLASDNLISKLVGDNYKSSYRKNGDYFYDRINNYFQITNISTVDSSLHFQSTGNDPSFILPDMKLAENKFAALKIDFSIPEQTIAQIFYLTDQNENFNGDQSLFLQAEKGRNVLIFYFPEKGVKSHPIRFDPGLVPGEYVLHSIEVIQDMKN